MLGVARVFLLVLLMGHGFSCFMKCVVGVWMGSHVLFFSLKFLECFHDIHAKFYAPSFLFYLTLRKYIL